MIIRKTPCFSKFQCRTIAAMNSLDTFVTIENAAHQGAFGDNHLPTPTDAQCLAGNYKLGRCKIHGIPVSIEQPRHSVRSGVDANGKRWETRLAAHYGYFTGVKGADGAGLDCFIGYYPQSDTVFVINQYVDGRFDEHKVMLNFPDEDSASKGYLWSYDRGWNGLGSIVPATIEQFKWWLKYGNKSKPLKPEHLPYAGFETMSKVTWTPDNTPSGLSFAQLLYQMSGNDGLILDAVSLNDIYESADEVLLMDAMVSQYGKLEQKMTVLMNVMKRVSGDGIKPVAMQLSEPYKQAGSVQVAAIFELSDGQTISVFFHNPDTTPGKITPTDDMISWKWLLNKKDITIIVAPEQGQDLDVRNVATRVLKLADKNSVAFARANQKRADELAAIEDLEKNVIPALETELATKQKTLENLVAARDEAEVMNAKANEEQNAAFAQEILRSLIDDYGWQSQGRAGSQVTKIIGGGREGGVVNPNGDRRVFAKVQGNQLVAMFGGNPLVSVDIDREADAKTNAGKLDAAVNAEDPRYVAPVENEIDQTIPETPQGDAPSEPDLTEEERFDREDVLAVSDNDLMQFVLKHKFETKGQTFSEWTELYGDSKVSAYDLSDYQAASFAETAFLVEKEVENYGGRVVFGNFDHTAYNAGLFDSAAILDRSGPSVMPGSIIGEIADKDGNVVARFRVEENGMLTMYKGASGLERVTDPTMAVSRINATVAEVFGGEQNKLQEPNLSKSEYPSAPEGWDIKENNGIGFVTYQSQTTDVKITYQTRSSDTDPGRFFIKGTIPDGYKFGIAPLDGYAGDRPGYVTWERIFSQADDLVDAVMAANMANQTQTQGQENPDGLTDAEMVVLIASAGYKAFSRLQNAHNETKTRRFSDVDDGISEEQYNAARDSLNAKGKYLKRSAITPEGFELVKNFHPDLLGSDKKLAFFAGKFANQGSASSNQKEEIDSNDMRGLAFAIEKDGKLFTSGSVPKLAEKGEITDISYYKKMADQVGGNLYVGGISTERESVDTSSLIMGMTWGELQARQHKESKPEIVKSKMPKDAVLVYSAPAENPTKSHIDTLQAIVDGQRDTEDLNALLDKIDAAASALEAAGVADQYDNLIGKAAVKWAELDQKANG